MKKIVYFVIGAILLSIIIVSCSPTEPAVVDTGVTSGPTPAATGLPEYVAPEGGLLAEIQARGVLRNGVECQNPPGEFFDPAANECTGFSIELAQMIADRIGVDLEIIETDWSGVIPALYAKNFDMILSSMTITEPRKQAVSFSSPVGCDQVTWIVQKGNTDISSPEDLDGKIVATQLGSAAEFQAQELQDEYGIEYQELKSFDFFDGAYLELKNGQADIATSTAWNNIPLFNAEPDTYDVAFSLPIFNYVGTAIRMQDQDLLNFVNEFLAEIEASGELANLQHKYYGYGMDCGVEGPNTPSGWQAP